MRQEEGIQAKLNGNYLRSGLFLEDRKNSKTVVDYFSILSLMDKEKYEYRIKCCYDSDGFLKENVHFRIIVSIFVSWRTGACLTIEIQFSMSSTLLFELLTP